MIDANKYPRCPECGGEVTLLGGKNRTRQVILGIQSPIPDDYKIPTCLRCRETSMNIEVSEPLDKLIMNKELEECMVSKEESLAKLVAIETKLAERFNISETGDELRWKLAILDYEDKMEEDILVAEWYGDLAWYFGAHWD